MVNHNLWVNYGPEALTLSMHQLHGDFGVGAHIIMSEAS